MKKTLLIVLTLLASIVCNEQISREIITLAPTSISDNKADDTISSVYSLTGVKQQGMQKGINIIRYSNGKTAKILNAR